ncbi:class I SAM-dependent methyltransferase [Paenibacillus woosongensis]|uniref:Class I SAM-dependent methyltransferase n=2 Tax=Paenibacillus TaxID=44249 RepID=A0ABQ4MWA5_9BACL|nr:class I SAM-dependent methyltransferase [Paenibacillus woosongensis]GIP60219.1 hypothetical protein J15TS10_40330 [Paenibacillus woosongensis]
MYSPVKVWMYCEPCEHIFSYNNPSSLSDMKFDGINFNLMPSKLDFLPTIGENLRELKRNVTGKKLLDVGIGGGELLAVAKELHFEVEGLEIVKKQADHIANFLGIPVTACDFLKYETDKRYDVITMGDVIEHIEDPAATIRKAYDLLNDRGILWISTPNYQSAHAQFVKFDDAMWKEAGHLHYFSFHSLKMILEKHQFQLITRCQSTTKARWRLRL